MGVWVGVGGSIARLKLDISGCIAGGACNNKCGQNAQCDNGACTCQPGFRNCDGDWSTGCEVDIRNNNANCDGCSTSTVSYACSDNA